MARRPHHHTVAGRLVECWRNPCRGILATFAAFLPPSEDDDA